MAKNKPWQVKISILSLFEGISEKVAESRKKFREGLFSAAFIFSYLEHCHSAVVSQLSYYYAWTQSCPCRMVFSAWKTCQNYRYQGRIYTLVGSWSDVLWTLWILCLLTWANQADQSQEHLHHPRHKFRQLLHFALKCIKNNMIIKNILEFLTLIAHIGMMLLM